jgi:NAD(P)-dependent dehydrogenase (short-subunit alcohol dehydrogenase family)
MSDLALVTGANRGLGFEVCRQLATRGLQVLLTARDRARGERAVARLAAVAIDVRFAVLDVADVRSIDRCVDGLEAAGHSVRVLVNNAGIYPPGRLLTAPTAAFRTAFETHFFGPLHLCRRLVPSMVRRGYGRVVNVSSGYGSFAEGLGGHAAYSLSKAALNALTKKLAAEVRGDVKVNAVCPGWVRTRMGGPSADLSVEDGADTIVWLATLPKSGPSGGFFRERRRVAW